MTRFLAAMSVVLGLILCCGAFAEPALERADPPEWVEDIALPEVDPELLPEAEDGVYWLLTDDQVRWDGETRHYHARLAIKVLNRAGLEFAAQVRRDFDPASDRLILTRLDILRDGKRISVRDRVGVDFLRLERDLPDGMINGVVTALIEVPDLRVGDVLDLGTLWVSEPLFEGQTFGGFFEHEYSAPVGLARQVLHWPAGRPFQHAPLPDGVEMSKSAEGAGMRIEMRHAAHVPIEVEADLPPEIDPWNSVAWSGASGWSDVTEAIAGHYLVEHAVPLPWQRLVADLQQRHGSDLDRAYAALRLVQDQIRYVGIEIGHGGYFARPPDQVVQNGYGDCKDKSVLLVTLLRALGIEADVALTDLDQGRGLVDQIPRSGVFDHMIVRAVVDGQTVWMDGTGSLEGGGRRGAVQPDLGFALPVTGKTAGVLLPIAPDADTAGEIIVTEYFSFRQGGIDLSVVTEARGGAADRMRYHLASNAPADLEAQYLDFYTGTYPGIEATRAVEWADETNDNIIRIIESYRLPPDALADRLLTDDFPFRADGFDGLLPDPGSASRSGPYFIGDPVRRTHRVDVRNLPVAIKVGDPVDIRSDTFSYFFRADTPAEGSLTLQWDFEQKARSVAPDQLDAYNADRAAMQETLYMSWNLTVAANPLQDFIGKLRAAAEAKAKAP